MSSKDELRRMRDEAVKSYPKLEITTRLDISKNESGHPAFKKWDAEKKEKRYNRMPIEGYYLGDAMVINTFSRNLGANGGSYISTPYWNNSDKIILLAPTANGYKKCAEGNYDEIVAYLSNKKTDVKKKKIIYIVNEKGVYAIETNVSLAIDNLKNCTNLDDKKIVITPEIYRPDDNRLTKLCKEKYLGPLAATNPPKYGFISEGDELTEEFLEASNAVKAMEDYIEWKKYTNKGMVNSPEEDQHEEYSDPAEQQNYQEENNDLPF